MADELAGEVESLTDRERAAVPLLIQDCSTEAIAVALCCTPDTVAALHASIQRKLGVQDRAALTEWALRYGIV